MKGLRKEFERDRGSERSYLKWRRGIVVRKGGGKNRIREGSVRGGGGG